MKGMKLSKLAYEQFNRTIIQPKYSKYINDIAVGLVGEGSECFKYDDDFSMDHDFGVGFCIWLNNENYNIFGKELQEDYDNFIKSHTDLPLKITTQYSYKRDGVFEIKDFFERILNRPFPTTPLEFRYIPMEKLANCTNGQIFVDNNQAFTKLYNYLSKYPRDIRLKKIAKSISIASQAGQYNYYRMAKRGDIVACNLCLYKFITNIMETIYLLNDVHMPFYKWAHHGMKDLKILSELKEYIENIYSNEYNISQLIEYISSEIIIELRRQNLTDSTDDFLFNHAAIIHEKINDEYLRYTNIMED